MSQSPPCSLPAAFRNQQRAVSLHRTWHSLYERMAECYSNTRLDNHIMSKEDVLERLIQRSEVCPHIAEWSYG